MGTPDTDAFDPHASEATDYVILHHDYRGVPWRQLARLAWAVWTRKPLLLVVRVMADTMHEKRWAVLTGMEPFEDSAFAKPFPAQPYEIRDDPRAP